jgi:hypothetical protein
LSQVNHTSRCLLPSSRSGYITCTTLRNKRERVRSSRCLTLIKPVLSDPGYSISNYIKSQYKYNLSFAFLFIIIHVGRTWFHYKPSLSGISHNLRRFVSTPVSIGLIAACFSGCVTIFHLTHGAKGSSNLLQHCYRSDLTTLQ